MIGRLHAFVLVSLCVAACGHAPDREPPASIRAATPAALTRDALVGVWSRPLPNGETNRLLLFESGIVGFQHLGAKLPVSRAYGRWSFAGDTLELDIVRVDPAGSDRPLASSMVVAPGPRANALQLEAAGVRSTWTAVPAPYGSGAGVEARARRDERDWTYLVETAAARAP